MSTPSAPSQFLCRLVPTRPAMLVDGPTEREARAVEAHFAYLQRLVGEGVVLMAGRTVETGERTFGLHVFVAESRAAAEDVLRADPAIVAGVMQGELFAYRVALWSPTWRPDPGGSPEIDTRAS